MESLYHQTNNTVKEIEHAFQRLGQISTQEALDVENSIQLKITQANSNCDRLDVLLFKVPPSQRQSSKLRVDQLKYDLRHLQTSLQHAKDRRQRREQEISEREQLLNHRFSANSTQPEETCLQLDYDLQHHTQLGSAHRGVDDMISSGSGILESLISQRMTLGGAHKRIQAIGSTLGLSNHTMKLIERRLVEDRKIFLGGMLVTLLIIGLIIYFLVL
ncbi:GL12214 [Drosophila persimilis]|uniref:GL12214 n=2 Tax=pseudoobscura subgroup TaxID=32358 RepID=B4H3B8_DROPE|nr:probable Golgi SNAP receptor complex member 2 [Drosophila pseudoobscura]XP_002025347.1 probable Golgi SNAP receptor complex member 2 [Drosophila persimilis]EDW30858.1 GL12214 [Drosophila persimilis]